MNENHLITCRVPYKIERILDSSFNPDDFHIRGFHETPPFAMALALSGDHPNAKFWSSKLLSATNLFKQIQEGYRMTHKEIKVLSNTQQFLEYCLDHTPREKTDPLPEHIAKHLSNDLLNIVGQFDDLFEQQLIVKGKVGSYFVYNSVYSRDYDLSNNL